MNITDSLIETLIVAEFSANFKAPSIESTILEIPTCQRTLFIGFSFPDMSHFLQNHSPRNLLHGADAYEFLLRFACGLESEIKGETDVFGQLKNAVKNYLAHETPVSSRFNSLFLKIFEDVREIRAEYLQGIGGNTYGALARRLLSPKVDDQVLVIGAGQISKSVAPYFSEFKLKLWNRSADRLFELKSRLEQRAPHVLIQALTETESLIAAIKSSSIVIIATPAGSEIDDLVRTHSHSEQKILHLGGQAADTTEFKNQPQFCSLTDLFLLEKEQFSLRAKQIHQATQACHNRALLRSMARSIHIAHGWEDLALFN